MNLSGKRILVMGLGIHGGGLGVARWLLRQNAVVTVTDTAAPLALAESVAQLDASAASLGTTVRYTLGEHRAEDILAADMLVVNPAVRPDSPWLALASRSSIPVETEMTLFCRVCPGPILGVTGTKGKTTTALMLAAMLRERFPDTVAAGNLRVSALEALDRITSRTPVVLELSSFQLERMGAAGLSPRYSLITNLSADHLNWHGSMPSYAEAKAQIYRHQTQNGILVLNASDPGSAEWFGGADQLGLRLAVLTDNLDLLAPIPQPAPTVRLVDEQVVLADPLGGLPGSAPGWRTTLFVRRDLHLPGRHNLHNAMLAAALAYAFGITPTEIATALRNFAGVEHRLELVRERCGVRYVNDTTATNPAAALAALQAIETPIVLIAGGADKQLTFDALAAAIARRVKALVLLEGSATPQIAAALAEEGARLPIVGPYHDFAAAIAAARNLAAPGDTVLLSPGCASFGMFRNEFHRGEEFRRIVGEL
ncbi:MAG: UDP-N-acetylmuramoyl-L-alanine--D-glutamate ligase [Oscillochloris sp.]|nr:UDP-N-acetylmuramoyl-L-alanine--D-glutamate ligase [Oscillochloris sp.]